MNFIYKYLILTILASLVLHAGDEKKDLDVFENYKKLTNGVRYAKTYEAYIGAKQAIYTFVDQCPEDTHSVDLLKGVARFFPTCEADVNIPLFRKIAKIRRHSKIYEAHMILYFYGDKEDKAEAMLNFTAISDNKKHPRQKCASEFLNDMNKNWDET